MLMKSERSMSLVPLSFSTSVPSLDRGRNENVRKCVCVCVCVQVLAEAERVGQKCDRSAANRSGIRKVENLVFAWLQVYSYL